jgi:hypothetical protein
MADRDAKGRCFRPDNSGENMGWAKLTEEAVIEIRRRYRRGNRWHPGVSYRDLATEFNVHPVTVFAVVRGLTWKHVKPS